MNRSLSRCQHVPLNDVMMKKMMSKLDPTLIPRLLGNITSLTSLQIDQFMSSVSSIPSSSSSLSTKSQSASLSQSTMSHKELIDRNPMALPPHSPPTSNTLNLWTNFIEQQCNIGHYDRSLISIIDTHTPDDYIPLSTTIISSLLSYPMTLALHLPPTNNPYIIVVGARKEATLPKKYWSSSYQSFSFVGPACPPLRSCKEGSTSFHYSQGLLTSTPNEGEAAVLFHPGLGHNLHKSGWLPALSILKDHTLRTSRPLLFTHYSQADLERDAVVVEEVFGSDERLEVRVERNEWMDLKDLREEDEGEGETFANMFCVTVTRRA
jgi:hypothetical protein